MTRVGYIWFQTDGRHSYRRKALYRREGSDESELESSWMYGIASVVTPVHCLRKSIHDRLGLRYLT